MTDASSRRYALATAFLCAALQVFYGGLFAGLGVTVVTGLMLLCGLMLIKKPRWHTQSILLLACTVLLSLAFTLFGSDSMRLLNLPVLTALTAQTLFSLSGLNAHAPLSAQGAFEGLRRFFRALFVHWGVPFRAAGAVNRGKALSMALLSLVIVVPLLSLVLLLLCAADVMFSALLQDFFQVFAHIDLLHSFWQGLATLVLTLLLFSLLYSLTQPPRPMPEHTGQRLPTPPLFLLTGALCAVYALFVYVQFRYLFGGAEMAQLEGGYASYARSGFFQLVAVALINLWVLFVALRRESRALRALCALLIVLTGILLFSALWRMRLYMCAYGLSTLRLLTLWAMGMIALALMLLFIKTARPKFSVCPCLLGVVLASWVALNYINVDYTIARYNVSAFAAGRLETLDVAYLYTLSADALPALPEDVRQEGAQHYSRHDGWFQWNLSARHLGKK